MQRFVDSFSVAAKAWVAAAVAAVAPLVIAFVQDQGDDLVLVGVGAVTAVVAWLATWAKPNSPA